MHLLHTVIKTFIVLIICCFFKVSTAQSSYPLNKSFAERYNFVDSLRLHMIYNLNNPEVARKTLNEWISTAKKNDDKALVYQLRFSSMYLPQQVNPIAREQKVLKDIEAALRDDYVLEAADGYYILAGWVSNSGRKAKAMEYALLGYDICKDLTIEEYPPKVKTAYRLAEWYYVYREFNRTISILLHLKDIDKKPINDILSGGELNTLALAYRELGQFDSSIHYFNIIYEDKHKATPISVRGIAAGNIGTIYQLNKDYNNAILWMKKELELWRKETGKTTSISCFAAYAGIGGVYTSLGNMSLARLYMDSAKQIRYPHNNMNTIAGYYRTYARFFKAEGDYKQALLYTDSLLIVKDSIAQEANLSKLLIAENKVSAAKHEVELTELNTIRQKSIWVRNTIILFILFVSAIVLLLINRSRLKHKQKELLMENEKNKAQAKLLSFTKTLQDRNRQISALQEENDKLTDLQDIVLQNELIHQLQQSTILTDEQWSEFRNIFEQVHAGYITRVKNKYPSVTSSEIRYMVLVMLDMDNKEIANVLGISVNSVRNYRFRLRKKIGLTDEDDLLQVIKSI